MIEIRILGRFSVHHHGSEIPASAFGGRRPRVLVRFLVINRGAFVARETLTEALWPRQAPADPAANLSVVVNRARRALKEGSLIVTGPGGYSFVSDDRCSVDAESFLAGVEAGRRCMASGHAEAALGAYTAALRLWRGEPLAEDAYEEWAQEYRSRLYPAHLEALESGSYAALRSGDVPQAVVLAERAVAREPLRESAHLLFVRALVASGDIAGALDTLYRLRRRFEELGLDISPKAGEMQTRLLRGEVQAGSMLLEAVHRPGEAAAFMGGTPTAGSPELVDDAPQVHEREPEWALGLSEKLAAWSEAVGLSWIPKEVERKAAWEMYVELITRIGIQHLWPEEGLLRGTLSSLYTLLDTTRRVLHRYGPDVAASKQGELSFGLIAVSMLNEVLRPFLTFWHTELAHYENQRPGDVSPKEHERRWSRGHALRKALAELQPTLSSYANLLSKVAVCHR